MNSVKRSRRVWDEIRQDIETGTAEAVRIPRGYVPHPRDAGARPTTTWPVGQIADYAFDGTPGKAPLAVREFDEHFEGFIDTARLTTQVLGAVERDPSKAMYVGAAMLGGAIGTSLSNKREGMLLGAGLGLLFAALLDASINDSARSRR